MANSTRSRLEPDDDTIVEMVTEAINSGKRATFYLSSAQSDAVLSWFFTPEWRCCYQEAAAS
jgi:hypothetical protein